MKKRGISGGTRRRSSGDPLGPAGIVKTRLWRELSRRVETNGGVAHRGRSLTYEERSPYRATVKIILKVANIYENDGVDVARYKHGGTNSSLYPASFSLARAPASSTRSIALSGRNRSVM